MPEESAIIPKASIVASKGSATKAAVRSFARTLTTDLKAPDSREHGEPRFTDTPAGHASEAVEQSMDTMSSGPSL
jgi:hypothetical protein